MDEPTRRGAVIRPMGIGEVLDTGFTLARRNFRLLAVTTAWGAVLTYLLYAIVVLAVPGGPTVAGVGAILGGIVIAIGAALASMAVMIACARLIEPTDDPTELEPGSLYGAALGRLGYSILWGIIFGIVSIPLAIVLPLGIYVWGRWAVSWPALIVEGFGPIAALGRSWSLTRGLWWHTVGVFVAIAIVTAVVSGVVSGVFSLAGAVFLVLGSFTISTLLNAVGGAISMVVFEPFSAALIVVLYYELRARREGFDLEQRGRMASPIQ